MSDDRSMSFLGLSDECLVVSSLASSSSSSLRSRRATSGEKRMLVLGLDGAGLRSACSA